MEEVWRRIQLEFDKKYPQMTATLNAGATENDFSKLEKIINKDIPIELKDFYRIHNGQQQTNLAFFDGDRLLSLEGIIQEWQNWYNVIPEIEQQDIKDYGCIIRSSPEKGIKNDWWNKSWIPITSNGCGDCYCIDLDPDAEGKYGQIIRMWHDDALRELVAGSFRDWIEKYILDLQANKYEFSDSLGWGGMLLKRTDDN